MYKKFGLSPGEINNEMPGAVSRNKDDNLQWEVWARAGCKYEVRDFLIWNALSEKLQMYRLNIIW